MELITESKPLSFKPSFHYLNLVRDNFYFILVVLMVLSYFYNLPVIKYSVTGDNEFRLYDVVGLFVLYVYYQNYNFYLFVIKKVEVFRWLHYFVIWCSITVLVTLIFSVYKERITFFIQSVLYLYHLWVFFITSIIFYVLSFNRGKLKKIVILILLLSVINCFIIILQNYGIVPFLWNDIYKFAYASFYSGTLGPNKIVTGMYSLILIIFSIGLFFNKKLKISKLFIVFVILINFYVLLLSGSRTSYVGLLVFLVFFGFYRTSGLLLFGIVVGGIFSFLILTNEKLYEKIDEVINDRIIGKIENEEDLENANMGKLYEDLGSGRDRLSLNYLNYMGENPAIIPFGLGFNNRLTKGFSAHNMYLNVVKELGLVGFVLYFGWLINYLFISFRNHKGYALALKGLVIAMLVTLFFGEHLYIYRPLFAILGLFLIVVNALISTLHYNEDVRDFI